MSNPCCCDGRCCFIFNCNKKPQFEKPGTYGEGCSLCIGIALFILALPELFAYYVYSDAFENGSAEACCGMISELTFATPGAVCFEQDFAEISPKFEKREVNGSMFCFVNNVKCDQFINDYDGTLTTIEECVYLPDQGYNITNMCSREVLSVGIDTSMGVFSSSMVILFGWITESIFLCQIWGCFKGSCCENRCVGVTNKLFEICAWCLFLWVGKVFVENAALNGYDSVQYLSNNPTFEYYQDNCDENGTPIWTEYQLHDVPEWLASDQFHGFTSFGLALSIIDFLIFFIIICTCCCCEKYRDDKWLPSGKEISDEQVTEDNVRRTVVGGDQQTTVQMTNTTASE